MNSPQPAESLLLEATVTASPDVIFAQLGPDVSLLNTRSGIYFTLNAVGASIWKQIQQPTALGEIKRKLLEEYEVDSARCEKDLFRIVEELRVHELALVVNP